ncbi:Anaerobic magnesium-protoporphyrin IX monomethyl ester cyclase [subsurface metagenome]
MAKPQRIKELDSLELPNRGIFEPRKYLQEGVILNVRTKRGCPFRCIYCTTPQIEGNRMRVITPQKVVDELEMLKKDYGADEFIFTDNIFNYPAKHAESICAEVISRGLDIKWYCIANPCSLSKDLLRLMKEAGCYGLSLGNESGSPQMLRNLGKNFTVEQVRQSCLYCRELGIKYTCFLLLGGPGENRKTVEESISTMERLKPDSLGITVGIRVYPNTELAQIAGDEGILEAHSDLLSPTFYLSREIKDWIFDYIKEVGERNGWRFPVLADTGSS